MQTRRAPRPARLVNVAVVLLLLAPAAPVAAQTRPRPPSRPGSAPSRQPRRPPEPGIQERSFILRQIEKDANRPPKPEKVQLALAQIGEDYERIQVVNNRMMADVMRAAAPDYRLVAETTDEMRRRAERLRQNLALPKDEGGGDRARAKYRPPADAAQLKSALLLLDGSLMSFVKSPLFKNIEVLEAEAAARASRDLQDVIELSRLIAADAERLGKASGSR